MKEKTIIYQVLPRLWGNGKFSSWNEDAAAYLRSLGVEYLWLTGVPRHATEEDFVKGDPGCPYAVYDWYDTNPYLATDPERRMQEFRELLDRMHSAGIKCLTDFIPNHVACNYKGALPLYGWHDGDWSDTLKVDWSNPDTEKEMLNVLRFWASMGVDGFRCDMVELVPSAALGRVVKAVKREFPGLLFVAEVYERDNYRRYIEECGFDLLYDKSGYYDIVRGILSGTRSARELTWNWQFLSGMQPAMLNFLENHDEQRFASGVFAGNADRVWPALAFGLLFNFASFMLYAGQEVGEDAAEAADGRTSIFNWCKPAGLGELAGFVYEGTALSAGRNELLRRYRELLTMSKHPVFSRGNVWDLCYCNYDVPGFDADKHFAFVRYNEESAWLVLCNFSAKRAGMDLRIPEELALAAGLERREAFADAPANGYTLIKLK